jgi:hypothetical protein
VALSADDVTSTLDYLGQTQPLAGPKLSLPGSSAGGGAVAAPVTGPGGVVTEGGAAPMGGAGGGGPSSLALAAQALGLARTATSAGRQLGQLGDLFADPSRGDTGGLSLSDQLRSSAPSGGLPDVAGPFDASAFAETATMGSGAEALAAGGELATGAAAAGETGAGVGAALGEALPYVGALMPLLTSFAGGGPQNATQGANLAVDTAAAAAAPFTFGASMAASGIARGIEDLLSGNASPWKTALDFGGLGMLAPFLDPEGNYWPKRQQAWKAAGSELSGLSSSYQQAAASGDPTTILQALSTGQGGRGEVRTLLSLPPDVAASLGLAGPQSEWSALTPEQFRGVLEHFRANPDAIASAITGSGDVAYLPQEQAQQVAGRAASDGQALITYLVNQMGSGEAPAQAPQPSAPISTSARGPSGPAGALGFADEALAS